MSEIFEIMTELRGFRSVSGAERRIAIKLSEMAWKHADSVSIDVIGNVIAHKKGSGGKVMITTAMDTSGLVATYIDDSGFVRFSTVGGIKALELLGCAVEFESGARGIVAADGKADDKEPTADRMYVDVGEPDAEGAKALVTPGMTAVIAGDMFLAGDRVTAPSVAPLSGCAALLRVMSLIGGCDADLYFVFAAQSKVGSRGAKVAASSIAPNVSLSVGAADADDIPESASKTMTKLGSGIGIKIMDDSVICHPSVVESLKSSASSAGIPIQITVQSGAASDAAPIHMSGGGIPSGALCVPVRYLGHPLEMCDLRDVEAAVKLASEFCKNHGGAQ